MSNISYFDGLITKLIEWKQGSNEYNTKKSFEVCLCHLVS